MRKRNRVIIINSKDSVDKFDSGDFYSMRHYLVPWKKESVRNSFRCPIESVLYEDIKKFTPSDYEEIVGVVIMYDLEDYSFLYNCYNLKQLSFYYSTSLRNLSFLEEQYQLTHLYISMSDIFSLDELVSFIKRKNDYTLLNKLEGINIQSSNKLDNSISSLKKFGIEELVINNNRIYSEEKQNFI